MIIRWSVAVHCPTEGGRRLVRASRSILWLCSRHSPVRVRRASSVAKFAAYAYDKHSSVFLANGMFATFGFQIRIKLAQFF